MFFYRRKRKLENLLRLLGLQGENLEKALAIAAETEKLRQEIQAEKNGYFGNFNDGAAAIWGLENALTDRWMTARRKVEEELIQKPPKQNIFCDYIFLR